MSRRIAARLEDGCGSFRCTRVQILAASAGRCDEVKCDLAGMIFIIENENQM